MTFVIRFFIKQYDATNRITKITLCMVIAGGFSNLLERIFLGHVVDYISISDFFSFPVFNIADIFIVIGWIFLIITTISFTAKTKKN